MKNLGENLVKIFKDTILKKGYVWFDDNKPYNLNVIGVRSADTITVNKFNDYIFLVFRDESLTWTVKQYPATTKPGLHYLLNPMSLSGTAIVVEGQYRGLWEIGIHQNQYDALVQRSKIKVLRDFDKNSVFSFTGKVEEGYYGINLHRAAKDTLTSNVNKYSAGCQVIQKSTDFDDLIRTANKSIDLGNPDSFTYTLLNENDF